VTRAEARKIKMAETLAEVRAMAERVLARGPRKPRPEIAGPTRKDRRSAEDAREATGKVAALIRSHDSDAGYNRCEVYESGQRCLSLVSDCHHAVGGRWKRECEALPNGDGFVACCRPHHDHLFHGPDRLGALRQAEEHALRIGSRGLMRLVDAAIQRYEAKHPRREEATR
jgi:hypothetical protein